MLSVGFVSLAAWVITITGIALALRNRLDAPYLLTFGAALMAVVGGLADVGVLSKSTLPVAFGDEGPALIRLLIAITIGLGMGIAIAGVLLTTPIRTRTIDNDNEGAETRAYFEAFPEASENFNSSDTKGINDSTATKAAKPRKTAKPGKTPKAKTDAKGWDLD